jgi:hypothetical protein
MVPKSTTPRIPKILSGLSEYEASSSQTALGKSSKKRIRPAGSFYVPFKGSLFDYGTHHTESIPARPISSITHIFTRPDLS